LSKVKNEMRTISNKEYCELTRKIELYEKNFNRQISDDSFLSGLLQGWANAIKDPKEIPRVIEDMIEMSKKLAKKSGVGIVE